MKFVVFDPNLIHSSGHYAAWDTALAKLAMDRGCDVYIVSHSKFPEPELGGFNVKKLFSRHMMGEIFPSYSLESWDKYHIESDRLVRDLISFTELELTSQDHVIFPSAEHNHLTGIVKWLAVLPAGEAPMCTVLLQGVSGCLFSEKTQSFEYYHTDVARFYKLAFRHAKKSLNPIQILACGQQYSEQYSFLSGTEIAAHPGINSAEQSNKAVLEGHQKSCLLYAGVPSEDKGFFLVPEVVRTICSKYPDWTFWVHADGDRINPVNNHVFAELSNLRKELKNFRYNTSWLDHDSYTDLFMNNDVALVSYDPTKYKNRISGIMWDAMSTASILVIPQATWMQTEAQIWKAEYELFEGYTALGLVDALERALRQAKVLRSKAIQCANNYRQQNSISEMDALLFEKWKPIAEKIVQAA